MKKALVIHPNRVDDIGNLAAIACAQAREMFHTKNRVRVYPWVAKHEDDFIVLVEIDETGRTSAQDAGQR